MSEFEELLRTTIKHYNDGNMYAFKDYAIRIYDSQHACCELIRTDKHHYLLGTIFSYMAEFYKFKTNIWLTLVESSLYYFSKTIVISKDSVERQNAAKRMLLLIEENEVAVMNIVKRFVEAGSVAGYNAHEVNRMLGIYCVNIASKPGRHSFLGERDDRRYENILKQNKYPSGVLSILFSSLSAEAKVFKAFVTFIDEVVGDPDGRRMAYSWELGM